MNSVKNDCEDESVVSTLLGVEKSRVLVVGAVSGSSDSLVRSISKAPGLDVSVLGQPGCSGQGAGQSEVDQIDLEFIRRDILSVSHKPSGENESANCNRDELTRDIDRNIDTDFDAVLYCGDSNGCEAVASDVIRLSKIYQASAMVVISTKVDVRCLELLGSGTIAGIIPASYSTRQMLLSLQLIRTGACVLPMEFRDSVDQQETINHQNNLTASGLDQKLTPRQIEVLGYVSRGKSNKYIAEELSLCESTVKVHVHEVMKRLGATSRTHASYIFNSLRQSAETSETGAATIQ